MNNKTFNTKEFWLYSVPVMVVDMLIHLCIFEWLGSIFRFTESADLVLVRPRTLYFLVVSFLFAVLIFPVRLYGRGVHKRDVIYRAFLQTLSTLVIFALTVDVMFTSFAGKFYLQQGIAVTVVVSLWHLLMRSIILVARRHGRNKVHVLIVGEGDNASALWGELMYGADFLDYRPLGFFSDAASGTLPEGAPRLGGLSEVIPYIEAGNKVHELYCSLNPAQNADYVNGLIRECENRFITFYYLPNMDGYVKRKLSFSDLGPVTVVRLREEPLAAPLNSFVKRLFDIVFSGLLLVTLYPVVWLFVAIGTTISSPGPILFRQQRTGYKAKPFTMLKFRSMKVNRDADTLQATKDDPRKTRFGNFLRRTSIDELPQLINIFRGDMSLIGPRPHMILHTETYSKLVDEYLVRHMVRPGLTGWAQVNGCRGETETVEKMARRVEKDIWYIEHWSFWLDIRIFLMTVVQVFKGDKQAY